MKNEYVVGDWVDIFSHNFQIMRADGYRENRYYYLDSLLFGDKQFYDCDINPIPLSIEILKENGWKEEVMTIGTRMNQLEKMGYDYAVAIATKAEIENGAACGQLAIICE